MAKRPTSTPKPTTAKQPDDKTAAPLDIVALVQAWDEARTSWQQADDGFKAATAALEALSADAPVADRDAAKQLLDDAQAALTSAEATIASLSQPLNEMNTTQSEGKDGGTGDLAGSAAAALDDLTVDFRLSNIRAASVISLTEALGMLDSDLAMIRGAITAATEVEARFVSLRAELQPPPLDELLTENIDPTSFAIKVAALVDSRWRIGREFTKEPRRFKAGELSVAELKALQADPMLAVSETVAD